MRQTAKNFAAFGSISEIMYSMFLTFLGVMLPGDVTASSPLPVNPVLLCGLAGLIAAGLGLAAAFMSPKRAALPRVFVCAAAVITLTVSAVMIMATAQLLLAVIFVIPALILTVAAVISFLPDKQSSNARI